MHSEAVDRGDFDLTPSSSLHNTPSAHVLQPVAQFHYEETMIQHKHEFQAVAHQHP
jgi:hypothetical protein